MFFTTFITFIVKARVNKVPPPRVADTEPVLVCACVCVAFLQAGIGDRGPGERGVADISQGAGAEGAAEGDGALHRGPAEGAAHSSTASPAPPAGS